MGAENLANQNKLETLFAAHKLTEKVEQIDGIINKELRDKYWAISETREWPQVFIQEGDDADSAEFVGDYAFIETAEDYEKMIPEIGEEKIKDMAPDAKFFKELFEKFM